MLASNGGVSVGSTHGVVPGEWTSSEKKSGRSWSVWTIVGTLWFKRWGRLCNIEGRDCDGGAETVLFGIAFELSLAVACRWDVSSCGNAEASCEVANGSQWLIFGIQTRKQRA